MRTGLTLTTALVTAAFCSSAVLAEGFPEKPVTYVVTFPAGGDVDVVVRGMQPHLEEALGQRVVVRNVGGAGGTIGAAEGAAADPDGYTLTMLAVGPASLQPHLRDLPYDIDSWEFVCRVTNSPTIALVAPDSDIDTYEELKAKALEGGMLYASPGPGSMPNIAASALGNAMGADLKNVPFQGGPEMAKAVLGGVVTFFTGEATSVENFGLKPVLVLSGERLATMPDVPSTADVGLDLELSIWYGILAPKGTPADVVQTLSDACGEAISNTSFQEFATKAKLALAYQPTAEFAEFAKQNYKQMGDLLADVGMKK